MTRGAERELRQALKSARATFNTLSGLAALMPNGGRTKWDVLAIKAYALTEELQCELSAEVAQEFVALRQQENAAEVPA